MADFDPQQVVDTVQSGMIPDDWRVFRASGRFYAIYGGFMAGAAVLFLGAFIITISNARTEAESFTSLSTWEVLLFPGVITIFFVSLAAYFFWQVTLAGRHWIAVTPTGFIEYHRSGRRIIRKVAFAHCLAMTWSEITPRIGSRGSPQNTLPSYILKWSVEPRYVFERVDVKVWEIASEFTASQMIAQTIVETYEGYVANHAAKPKAESEGSYDSI